MERKGVITDGSVSQKREEEIVRNYLHNKEEENRDDNLRYRQHIMLNYGNRLNARSCFQLLIY